MKYRASSSFYRDFEIAKHYLITYTKQDILRLNIKINNALSIYILYTIANIYLNSILLIIRQI